MTNSLVQWPHIEREVTCRGEAGEAEVAVLGGILNMNRMTIHATNIWVFQMSRWQWEKMQMPGGTKQWKKHRMEKVIYFEVCAFLLSLYPSPSVKELSLSKAEFLFWLKHASFFLVVHPRLFGQENVSGSSLLSSKTLLAHWRCHYQCISPVSQTEIHYRFQVLRLLPNSRRSCLLIPGMTGRWMSCFYTRHLWICWICGEKWWLM